MTSQQEQPAHQRPGVIASTEAHPDGPGRRADPMTTQTAATPRQAPEASVLERPAAEPLFVARDDTVVLHGQSLPESIIGLGLAATTFPLVTLVALAVLLSAMELAPGLALLSMFLSFPIGGLAFVIGQIAVWTLVWRGSAVTIGPAGLRRSPWHNTPFEAPHTVRLSGELGASRRVEVCGARDVLVLRVTPTDLSWPSDALLAFARQVAAGLQVPLENALDQEGWTRFETDPAFRRLVSFNRTELTSVRAHPSWHGVAPQPDGRTELHPDGFSAHHLVLRGRKLIRTNKAALLVEDIDAIAVTFVRRTIHHPKRQPVKRLYGVIQALIGKEIETLVDLEVRTPVDAAGVLWLREAIEQARSNPPDLGDVNDVPVGLDQLRSR